MRLRVMVVEDDKYQLEAIRDLLQKKDKVQVIATDIEGVDVTRADCASVARRLLEEAAQHSKSYDILLLDLGLPENPGEQELPELGLHLLELARRQQAAAIIIVLSVFTQIEYYVAPAFRRGATDILAKPYRDERLLDIISRNWQGRRPATIFLNYARDDKNEVLSLYHKLTDEGFIPWMDIKNLLPGQVRKFAKLKAIRESDFVLVCLSKNSVSERGFLQHEIQEALEVRNEKLEEDIYLIPVRLENCEVPASLQHLHCADIFEADEWDKLVEAIRKGTLRLSLKVA